MKTATVEQIANSILYEGYLLYPYRASALKNRQRWNYGVVYPRAYCERRGVVEPWSMQTQCLLLGSQLAGVDIKVRFLHLAQALGQNGENGPSEPWQEGIEREVVVPEHHLAELLAQPVCRMFSFREMELREGRSQHPIHGSLYVAAEETDCNAYRVTVRIENLTLFPEPEPDDREAVLLRSFISTHAILQTRDGEFISLLDPPGCFREASASCNNIGTWPVLAGDAARQNTVLSSPVILYDYPEIAPESPGDLFDGTEIDEILTLRILTMTDEEKNEMRRTDPRAREILERTEGLPPEHFMRLHGVLRALHPAGESDA